MTGGRDAALEAFDEIRRRCPRLRCDLDRSPEHVELVMRLPAQAGLLFDVELMLQNDDELHLVASALWVGWFPCTEPEVRESFVDAVCGLLAGRFRILEHHRGSRAVKAELQRPAPDGVGAETGRWETITSNSWMWLPWPPKRLVVVQNAPFHLDDARA